MQSELLSSFFGQGNQLGDFVIIFREGRDLYFMRHHEIRARNRGVAIFTSGFEKWRLSMTCSLECLDGKMDLANMCVTAYGSSKLRHSKKKSCSKKDQKIRL